MMRHYTLRAGWHFLRRRERDVLAAVDELAASHWWSQEKIQANQLAQLRRLIDDAYRQTAYYREVFDKIGLRRGADLTRPEDIQSIPVLTKDIVRSRLDDLTTVQPGLIPNQTGGSTGMPLRFHNSQRFWTVDKPASMHWAYTMGGYRIGNPMGVVWGFDNDLPRQDALGRIDPVLNLYAINSFALTAASLDSFVATLRRNQVRFIKGYATSLLELARHVGENGVVFDPPIRAVFSEAERLDESARSVIETALGARVYNYYGCREFSTNAVECGAHEGLHVNVLQLYPEILSDTRLLLTSFRNRGTIFIRYEIGDCADRFIIETCRCGRRSYRINKVFGRESDNFRTPSGKVIHGEYVTHLFYPIAVIKQFQIVQTSYTHFDISLVADDSGAAMRALQPVMERLNQMLGYAADYQVAVVDAIDKTRTGKFKFTISRVPR